MKRHPTLNWLIPLIIILASLAAICGLLIKGGDGAFEFTSLYGQVVRMGGHGLYRNDSLFSAATFRATDAVTLVVGVPLLVLAFVSYLRGSIRGGLVLAGAVSYFLYIGASMAFSASFNNLFLVYVALFSASLFGLIIILTSIDLHGLPARAMPALPHRGISIFLLIAGFGTLAIWLSDLAGPILAGKAPETLGPYTTLYTYAFDSAVITPAAALTGLAILSRKPLGYLLAAPIMILCIMNGIVVIASTAAQTLVGIIFPVGVYIGMIGSWVVMGAFATGLTIAFFRNFTN